MAEDSKIAIDWEILNLDTNELIIPQFPMPADGVQLTIGGELVEQRRFGFQDPVTHWTAGRPRTLTFAVVLYARDETEQELVKFLFERLEGLALKDPDLGRPPICDFKYGNIISEKVLVESTNPNILSVDPFTQNVREIRITMQMRRYVPFSQAAIDPTAPTKESFMLVASEAEQGYEAIAKRRYGDPLLGDRLRKRLPARPFAAEIGDTVPLPNKSIILQEVVAPAFHALSLTDEDAVNNFERILEDRTKRTIIEVV